MLSVRTDREQRRGSGAASAGKVQVAFDNWLRDRHRNEIMLVNLSSINYHRSRPQCVHYSRGRGDPAGRAGIKGPAVDTVALFFVGGGLQAAPSVVDGLNVHVDAEPLFHTELGNVVKKEKGERKKRSEVKEGDASLQKLDRGLCICSRTHSTFSFTAGLLFFFSSFSSSHSPTRPAPLQAWQVPDYSLSCPCQAVNTSRSSEGRE